MTRIVAFLLVLQLSKVPVPMTLYYLVLIMFLVRALFYTKKRFNRESLIHLLYVTSLLALIDTASVLMSEYRFISYVVVLLISGVIFTTQDLFTDTKRLLQQIIVLNRVLLYLSFTGYLLGLPLVFGRGGFTGLYSHSMIIGPVGSLLILWNLSEGAARVNQYARIINFMEITMIVLLVLLSGSRGSLLGLFVATVFYFWKKGEVRKLVLFAPAITSGLVVFSKSFGFADRMIAKTQFAGEQGSVFFSRLELWETRMREFLNSPIIGNGFYFDSTVENIGKMVKLEPGSSYLFILSTTGLIGLILLLFVVLNSTKYFLVDSSYKLTLNLLLIFFGVHLIFEGYIFSSGSALMVIFWLIVGLKKSLYTI